VTAVAGDVPGGSLPTEWEDALTRLARDLDAAAGRDGAPQPWSPPHLAPDGLDPRQRAELRRRLIDLHGRVLALTSRITAAQADNRRRRALLERAEPPHDRPVFVDRRA